MHLKYLYLYIQWRIQSFFEWTGIYIEPTKAPSWLMLSRKFSKFVPPDGLKMHSLALPVVRFLRKTFSRLLKFTLRNTALKGWFFKNSYIQIKNLYGYKLARTEEKEENVNICLIWYVFKLMKTLLWTVSSFASNSFCLIVLDALGNHWLLLQHIFCWNTAEKNFGCHSLGAHTGIPVYQTAWIHHWYLYLCYKFRSLTVTDK